jgi:hypothetical protein
MNKKYIAPDAQLLDMTEEIPVATSPVKIEGIDGLGYGGQGQNSDEAGVKNAWEIDW